MFEDSEHSEHSEHSELEDNLDSDQVDDHIDTEEGEAPIQLVSVMAMKINPPLLNKCKNYAAYTKELAGWKAITSVDKKARGYAVALSLPHEGDSDDSDIRSLVFEQLSEEQLTKEDGLDTLIKFMDKHLQSDELTNMLEKSEDFEDYRRKKDQSISEYIAKFDQKISVVHVKSICIE